MTLDDTGPGTKPATYEAQLAARVGELLPDLDTEERLELLDAMGPDDMSTSLAWIAAAYPQVFDFAIVRDRALAALLTARLAEGQDHEGEPSCRTCGAVVGVFLGHGEGWHHFRGQGTADSPVELYDAGHEAVPAWLAPPGRELSPADIGVIRQALADASAWRTWRTEGDRTADLEQAAGYEALLRRLVVTGEAAAL
jgi:hypothetical protein